MEMEIFSFVFILTILLIDGSSGGNTPSSGNYHLLSNEEAREATNNLADMTQKVFPHNDTITRLTVNLLWGMSKRNRNTDTFHDDEAVMRNLQMRRFSAVTTNPTFSYNHLSNEMIKYIKMVVRIGNQYCLERNRNDPQTREVLAKANLDLSKSRSHRSQWKGICELNYKLKIAVPETDAECIVKARKKEKITFVYYPRDPKKAKVLFCSCHIRDGVEEELIVADTTYKNPMGDLRTVTFHHLRESSGGTYNVIATWIAYSNVSQAIIYPDGFSRSSDMYSASHYTSSNTSPHASTENEAYRNIERNTKALTLTDNNARLAMERKEAEDLDQAIMNSLLEYTKQEAESSSSVGLSEESSSSERQDPDLATGYRIDPLFLGDPLSIENYVHRNIKSVDDRWISGAEPADLPKICVKAFNINVGDNGLKATCSSKESDGQIVYKQLENVPADTTKLLHCVCQAKIGEKDIEDPFYLLEMGFSETAEHSVFHYIYLDSDNNGGGVSQKCFIQFGWKITMKK